MKSVIYFPLKSSSPFEFGSEIEYVHDFTPKILHFTIEMKDRAKSIK